MSDPKKPLRLEPLPPGPPNPTEECVARMNKQREEEERRYAVTGRPQSANPHRFTDQDFTFDADFRGEELTYEEGGRRATISWTWTNGYKVYWDSLTSWINADGSRSAVSDEERAEILHRAIKYAREKQNVIMMVVK